MKLKPFVFEDKASFVLRAMFKEPGRTWVGRDFVQKHDVSLGLASRVLKELRERGFIKGKGRGRLAGAVLREEDEIVKLWTHTYNMEKNRVLALYSEDKNILKHLGDYSRKNEKVGPLALTLHSGANLTTGYVRDSNVYLYVSPEGFMEKVLKMRQALNLKELKEGGNIFIFKPTYKKSVFFGLQRVKGYPVVSNLQLYLDLYHFSQKGTEQAEMLTKILKRKGKNLGYESHRRF